MSDQTLPLSNTEIQINCFCPNIFFPFTSGVKDFVPPGNGYAETLFCLSEMMTHEALEETFVHLRHVVENGCKYMPDENPESKKNNFKFFYNRVIPGDNTIMVVTDRIKTAYINYDVLNYMYTRDETFCEPCYIDMQKMMKKSTLISQTGEKHRNIFFGIILNKIKERIKMS